MTATPENNHEEILNSIKQPDQINVSNTFIQSIYSILSSLSFCYLVVDPVTQRIQFHDTASLKLYQYSSEELAFIPYYILYDSPWESVTRLFKFTQTQSRKHVFVNQKRKDGTLFNAELFIGPFDYQNQDLFYVFVRNLTEIKTKENRLIESEKRYKTLFLKMNNPYSCHRIELDEKKQITTCYITEINHEFKNMVLKKEHEIIGKPITQIIPALDQLTSPWMEYVKKVMVDHNPVSVEVIFGSVKKNYLLIAYPITETEFAIVFEDITSQKRLDRLRNAFINTLTHEIRTPLTAIKAGMEIWMKNPDSPLVKQENLPNMIQNNVMRIINLINEVLDYQKIDNQPFAEFYTQQSINKVITEITGKMQNLFDEKNVKLQLELDDSIQKSWFYKDKISQVLINLITNSAKFTNYGQVVITTILKRDEILVKVSDTGIGIEQEAQKKLFDTFYQVNSPHKEGAGLGLPICRKIIERHGGTIWVESKPFQGSSFFFTIPYDTLVRTT